MRREVIEAARDYRYLLDRGYPNKAALDLVATRYMLSRKEKLLLYRCIHSINLAREIRSKVGKPPRGSMIVIDGFNVFATIYSAMKGDHVYICDDGIVRDLSGLHSRVAVSINREVLRTILDKLINVVAKMSYTVSIVLDANIKYSGESASYIRSYLANSDVKVDVIVDKMADRRVIDMGSGGWVSSSDIVVLMRVPRIYDLAGEIIRVNWPRSLVKIPL